MAVYDFPLAELEVYKPEREEPPDFDAFWRGTLEEARAHPLNASFDPIKSGLKTVEVPSPPSDLLGVSAAGYFYLLAYTDTNLYTLQIADPSGRVRAQRRVVIEDSELTFRDIHLSPSGIIYGLLADKSKARVAWWRSDLLLKGE